MLWPVLARAKEEAIGDHVLDHDGSVRKTFETTVEKAGMEDVTPHVLRHTWATRAVQEGASLIDVAGVLGDRIETVTRVYLHHCPNHLKTAINTGHGADIMPVSAIPDTPPASGDKEAPRLRITPSGALPVSTVGRQ